jgi:tryptophan halogenase
MNKNVVIVGSGTAGMLSAIMLKDFFAGYDITVISSKEIGIIGVGEGSTEHWKNAFMRPHHIDVGRMVEETDATHKYGIRYEDWTTHTPEYFHSVSLGAIQSNNFVGNYAFALENNWLLTNVSTAHLRDDTVLDSPLPHNSTNQFHFDTFKLNRFLGKIATERGVSFVEGIVTKVERNPETGFIESLVTDTGLRVAADFVIDASGFKRVVMSQLEGSEGFVSYRKYLPCDSSAVFPTPMREDGKIHPFTRARAMPNGWMFEIPTQKRRGNGYIFSSDFCSDEQAVRELSEAHGKDITPAKIIKFKSGYFSEPILFNCASVGLASSFVEPLEATSISTTIQQVQMIASLIPTFHLGHKAQVRQYKKRFEHLMENIVTMIALHYMSDRKDTEMWKAQKNAEKPALLQELLEIWSERSPQPIDVPGYHDDNGLFHLAHFYHVAQGQGVLSPLLATEELNAYRSRADMIEAFIELRTQILSTRLIDHASIFPK